MGERKGTNKYYPPDYDPSKGSLNSWQGTHPLRDRARKIHQGILVIRFEMPYNIWCNGCNSHIGMGVRYNAEKSKAGNYYTTPIYKFRMKCHLCDNYFEIQTDPKNHDYVILEGARRKEQRWDPRENEQIVPEDKATQKKLVTDPMYKLEHGSDDQQRGKSSHISLAHLEDQRDAWKDDYILNKMARNKFREEKKQIFAIKEADQAVKNKSSLDIELVPESEEDRRIAGLVKYSVTKSFDEKQIEKRKAIENRPLFSPPTKVPSQSKSIFTSSSDFDLNRTGQIKRKIGLPLVSPKAARMTTNDKLYNLVNTIGKNNKNQDSISFDAKLKPVKNELYGAFRHESLPSVETVHSENAETSKDITPYHWTSSMERAKAVQPREALQNSNESLKEKCINFESPSMAEKSEFSELTLSCKGPKEKTNKLCEQQILSHSTRSSRAPKVFESPGLSALFDTYSDSDSSDTS